MIIGIDASRANIAQKTGTELYSYTLIEEFKKLADVNDRFLLYSKDKLNFGLEILPPNFESRVLRWPPKFLWTQIRLSVAMAMSRQDVLFVPAHTIPLHHPKNTVVTVHDIGFEQIDRLYDKKMIGSGGISRRILSAGARLFTLGKYSASELDYHRWATEYAIRHAKKIITVSEFSKNEIIKRYGISKNKVAVIYHGINRAVFKKIDDTAAIRTTLDKMQITSPFLLYVGRLEEKKNTPGLIKIFRILKTKYKLSHQLVLVGKPGLNYEAVNELIDKYNLNDFVVRPGYVNEDELIHLRNAADVFIFPSMYEGFGMPILESMACGTPVVCSRAASLPEVAGDAALMANPEDYEEFALKIHRVVADADLRNNLVNRGWERISHFRWDVCAKKTLEIIKEP